MFSNYKKILLHLACWLLLIWLMLKVRSKFGIAFDLLIIFYLAVYIGYIISRHSGQMLSDSLFTHLFHPRQYLRRKPIPTAPAAGMINMHRYDEAEAELKKILQRQPDNAIAALLLTQLYLDHLKNFSAAEQTAAGFLNRGRPAAESMEIINAGVDAALAQQQTGRAIALLRRELSRKEYDAKTSGTLKTRLESLLKISAD